MTGRGVTTEESTRVRWRCDDLDSVEEDLRPRTDRLDFEVWRERKRFRLSRATKALWRACMAAWVLKSTVCVVGRAETTLEAGCDEEENRLEREREEKGRERRTLTSGRENWNPFFADHAREGREAVERTVEEV